jgi:ABC-type transport system involved in cytochrome c biogenesis permease subunit
MYPAFVMLALFATIAFSLKTIVDARSRTKLLQSNPHEGLVEAILKGEERRRRQSALRWGIVLVFLAAGFGIVEIMEWKRPSPGVIAVLLGATGFGNIASYLVCRKVLERDSGTA